jgi:hypothetical protein
VNYAEFLDRFKDALAAVVLATYPPRYTRQQGAAFDLTRLLRRPLGGQADAIRAAALSLRCQPATTIVGEMGSGKTFLAAAAAFLAGHRRVVVLCPPHLVRKWRREIEQTVPGARVAIVRTIGELERARRLGGPFACVVLSREQAKLGGRWRPAALEHPLRDAGGKGVRDEAGALLRVPCCPGCFAPVVDDQGVPLDWSALRTKKRRCRACGGALWQLDRTGPRRAPLADYVRQRMPGFFELCVVDELHEYKARGSAQGLAAAALTTACPKTLTLTGTVAGGYASTLFYLLYRFSPALRSEFAYGEEAKFVGRYGIVERISKKDPDAYGDDGRHSKRRDYLVRTVEKPGIVPAVLTHLLGNTIFLRLADVAANLPPYSERVLCLPLDTGADPDAPSQASCYRRLASDLRRAVLSALHEGSKRLLATYLQALLTYPDACTREEVVLDPVGGQVIAEAPALPAEQTYPKERAFLELVLRERGRGRRVLAYLAHTETRDLSPRLSAILERAGIRVAVLKAATVPPERREEWVAARVKEGVEVLLTQPRLVQTGLDLVAFPSIVWLEPEYSIYTMRQASRRSWRIGQREPVEVSFLVYERTLQAEALALVAAKLRSSLMVEGELPEDGLAALDDGQDLFLALARQLAGSGGTSDGHSLEALFARTKAQEAAADDLLVADTTSPDAAWPGTGVAVASPSPASASPSSEEPSGISFLDLERLVRRQRSGHRVAPGQLSLFDS